MKIRRFIFVISLASSIFASCSEKSGLGIFAKKSLHEQYGQKLTDAGLEKTALGQQWFKMANNSVANSVKVTLPYQERGYFAADKPKSTLLNFDVRRGEKINIKIEKKSKLVFTIYADAWYADDLNGKGVANLDSNTNEMVFEAEKDGNFVLRLQPELLSSGEYLLQITKSPSLAFPVQGKNSIQSFWGDGRDNNSRKHEGVDIFASRGTPAIAAADGTVTRVGTNNLGGNVVFMQPAGKSFNLYYAHLDKQLVQDGQAVKLGDTLGLVGNTGNAITTTPHLHFGIYQGGAVDPEPFINTKVPLLKKISSNIDLIGQSAKIRKQTKGYQMINGQEQIIVLPDQTIFKIDAATDNGFRIDLPDQTKVFIPAQNVSVLNSVKRKPLKVDKEIYDFPDSTASRITTIKSGQDFEVMGKFNNFSFIKTADYSGWIIE